MSRKKIELSKNNFASRLYLLRSRLNLTIKQIAESTEISKSTLSELEGNKYNPSSKALIRLSDFFKVDSVWLLTGEGEMKRPVYEQPEDVKIGVVKDDKGEYSIVTQKILQMLEGMTEDERRDILRYIEKEKLLGELMKEKKAKAGGKL